MKTDKYIELKTIIKTPPCSLYKDKNTYYSIYSRPWLLFYAYKYDNEKGYKYSIGSPLIVDLSSKNKFEESYYKIKALEASDKFLKFAKEGGSLETVYKIKTLYKLGEY